ncbi:bifunctional heptose 7-phosphate kinase/heptose 1-phosphate adenyltransferase [Saccharicrinis fermentans]|uniref:Bifunctional protein HldE n=1 Tax=Saccharicrinis fermentans DSM 9555 = JCM 21142 TaxID=869213 RepID=W7YLJ2_9BACT|nr:PfkB family carbohydrate kinase [Saccharicrinis fermentans]GAF05451.1 bifunctional protein HldE [Saccharicrinis fermentans DSM 9555 = JCM 21142]
MSQDYFANIFQSFNDKNILILGDVMIDSYLWGDVNRISPEAPVPILSGIGRENRLGGAANVALNIQALGANPILCSVIGDDLRSHDFFKLLKNQKLSKEGIVTCKDRMTTVKTRVISQHQHLLRVDEEICTPIDQDSEEKLLTKLRRLTETIRVDAIIFEDYDKGVITPSVIKKVVDLSNNKGIPTLVDPKKRNFNDYKGVTFFKPNFKEFNEGCKLELSKGNTEELIAAGKAFQKEQNIEILMITLSEHGVFINTKDDEAILIPAEVRSISDVSGAGDTVISVSSLCLIQGMETSLIARIANMAGGLVCEESGVVPINRNLLLQECIQNIEL